MSCTTRELLWMELLNDGGGVLRLRPCFQGNSIADPIAPEPLKACGSPAKPSTAAVQPFDSRALCAQ